MKRLFLTLVVSAFLPGAVASQSADELAEAAANPIADLISLPFQLNNDFGLGEFDVVKPDIGPDWQLRIQLQTLLPGIGG